MKFNPSFNTIVTFLVSLAFLQIPNPAIALVNKEETGNYQINLGLDTTQEFTKKQPIQIAKDDYYWGPQRDFQIWMPGEAIENTENTLVTQNISNKTVYMLSHKDMPLETLYLSSKEIREVLQLALRVSLAVEGKVVKTTDMVVEGYPGIDLLIQHSDGTQGQYQGYVVRRRLYLMGARTTDELTTEANYFFSSFRVYPTRIVNSR